MNFFTLILLLTFLVSCESTDSDDTVRVSRGYAFLNQGATSSIDYYDVEKDSIIIGIFQRNNNSETLAGYAEHLNRHNGIIAVTLQGSFGVGTGGKVILLNDNFEIRHEITDFPANHNTLYTLFRNDMLYVSYRKSEGSWPNTVYSYTIRKFQLNDDGETLTATQVGQDLSTTIQGFGYGRMTYADGLLFIHDNHTVDVIDPSSFSILRHIELDRSIADITSHNGKVYLAAFNLETVEGKDNLNNGGYYILNNGQLEDSVITDYGYKKMFSNGNELFGIKWKGSGRIYNSNTFSYEWESLETSMMRINRANQTSVFISERLQKISDGWVHFNYDADENLFMITDAAYSNSNMRLMDSQGLTFREMTLTGQTCQAIILD